MRRPALSIVPYIRGCYSIVGFGVVSGFINYGGGEVGGGGLGDGETSFYYSYPASAPTAAGGIVVFSPISA